MIQIIIPAASLCKLFAVGVVAFRGHWEARKAGYDPITALIWGGCAGGILLALAWFLAD